MYFQRLLDEIYERLKMDDSPARTMIATNIRNNFKVKVDPQKHTYFQLQNLQLLLILTKKLKRDFNVVVDWHTHTVEQLRVLLRQHNDEFLMYD